MKSKLFKRSINFLLVMLMALSNVSIAFAAELPAGNTMEVFVDEKSDFVLTSVRASTTIPSNGSATLYPELSNTGVYKNLAVNAKSDSTSGALMLYLYDANDKLVSDDWIMGVNETTNFTVYFPSTGEYRLVVYASGTNASVDFFCNWI